MPKKKELVREVRVDFKGIVILKSVESTDKEKLRMKALMSIHKMEQTFNETVLHSRLHITGAK